MAAFMTMTSRSLCTNLPHSPSQLITVLLFAALLAPAAADDNMLSTAEGAAQSLEEPRSLVSSNGVFRLGFFSPAPNSSIRYLGVWYDRDSASVVWVANRNAPLTGSPGGLLMVTEHGGLELLNSRNETLWSSGGGAGATLASEAVLLDSGNLVLRRSDASGRVLWQSFDHPTDSFLSGMKLVFAKTPNSGGSAPFLSSWKGASNPSEGHFSLGLDSFSLPQLVIWDGGGGGQRLHWRSGPWGGSAFTGVQYGSITNGAGFVLVTDRQATMSLTYTYLTNSTTWSFYVLSEDGALVQKLWDDSSGSWDVAWQALATQCDSYSRCGAFASCNPRGSPFCRCLKGFVPKHSEEWIRGNWTGGCVRKTKLQCVDGSGGADGFWSLPMLKVPDMADWQMGLDGDECWRHCSSNCSCLAYVYDSSVGCMSWNGELIDTVELTNSLGDGLVLYVRLASSELDSNSRSKKIVVAAVGSGALAVCAFICILGSWMIRREKRSKRKQTLQPTTVADERNAIKIEELPLFKYEVLVKATGNFAASNKLGQGGFGPVYRGRLEDGREIAVKKLFKGSVQGMEEFMNEVVVISKLQHRNLVRLLGCCTETDEKMLIYEYLANKSLDSVLFDTGKRRLLDWSRRFNIIQGICRGLLYLHRDSRLRIVHRDLKAANILLDEDLNPKISDFGMAKIFGGDQHQDMTRRIVGTYGYMAPEYAMEGKFSEKSDVFSFGVLLLEIVSGIKNSSFWYEELSVGLIGYAWNLWNENNIVLLVDPIIFHTLFYAEIKKCVQVGLLCVQELAMDRPNIPRVIKLLGGDIGDVPSPKPPGFTLQRQLVSSEGGPSSSSQQRQQQPQQCDSGSIFEASVTTLVGR